MTFNWIPSFYQNLKRATGPGGEQFKSKMDKKKNKNRFQYWQMIYDARVSLHIYEIKRSVSVEKMKKKKKRSSETT